MALVIAQLNRYKPLLEESRTLLISQLSTTEAVSTAGRIVNHILPIIQEKATRHSGDLYIAFSLTPLTEHIAVPQEANAAKAVAARIEATKTRTKQPLRNPMALQRLQLPTIPEETVELPESLIQHPGAAELELTLKLVTQKHAPSTIDRAINRIHPASKFSTEERELLILFLLTKKFSDIKQAIRSQLITKEPRSFVLFPYLMRIEFYAIYKQLKALSDSMDVSSCKGIIFEHLSERFNFPAKHILATFQKNTLPSPETFYLNFLKAALSSPTIETKDRLQRAFHMLCLAEKFEKDGLGNCRGRELITAHSLITELTQQATQTLSSAAKPHKALLLTWHSNFDSYIRYRDFNLPKTRKILGQIVSVTPKPLQQASASASGSALFGKTVSTNGTPPALPAPPPAGYTL